MHSLSHSRFYTPAHVAQWHGVAVDAVLAAVDAGELEHLRIDGRVLITAGNLAKWQPSAEPAAMEGG